MKDKQNFRSLNCDGCQCNVCQGSCMNCYTCYRAEYADKSYDDCYVEYSAHDECIEI